MLWPRGDTAGRLFAALFASRPLVFLGECYYSLYLIHRPIQVALALLLLGGVTMTPVTMLAIQLAGTALAVLALVVMWFAMERPAIWLGRRLVGRSRSPVVEQAIAAAP